MSLRDIYYRISETAIGDVKARNLDEIKLAVRASDCPMRLLLPATEGVQGYIAIGTLTKTTWTIRDLCLWQPIIEGTGIEQCGQDMLAYVELYGAAMRALVAPTPESTLLTVSFKLGPILWVKTDFWAVDTILTIEEYLQ